ncbi:MAG: permease [Selenomonadaceae bacterium]|uniref:permease n=1 Tax=Anaerovibrio slackiae TaxID=2652309 RepID=UPI00386A2A2B|nr:permease [Selenomonadaceae bacterium]MBR0357839.1 permease [Selenomonadaceae bacterium]
MFDFFMQEVLGMHWLSELVWLVLMDMGASQASPVWGSVHFFIYDTIKISILLVSLIFFISYIQSYFPPERTKRILTGFTGVKGAAIAALLGTVTPFCSCSSIPIFIGFTRAGLPLGMTFAFLISSPMVDVASMLMLMSFFGSEFAVIYVVVGLLLAIGGGLLLNVMKMEKYIRRYDNPIREFYSESEYFNQRQRIGYACNDTRIIVKNVFPYVLAGVAIGAFLHNWVPQDWILAVLGEQNVFSVPLAALIGIPIYADIFGAIPIAEALYLASVPAGTILALMMAITTLSLPSLIMLSKVLERRLLFTFIGIVAAGIILIGYLFNILM